MAPALGWTLVVVGMGFLALTWLSLQHKVSQVTADLMTAAAAMGVPADVVHLPPRHEVVHAYASHERARQTFSGVRETALEDGLERMAHWVRRHGARSSAPFRDIEITKGLPAAWQQ